MVIAEKVEIIVEEVIEEALSREDTVYAVGREFYSKP